MSSAVKGLRLEPPDGKREASLEEMGQEGAQALRGPADSVVRNMEAEGSLKATSSAGTSCQAPTGGEGGASMCATETAAALGDSNAGTRASAALAPSGAALAPVPMPAPPPPPPPPSPLPHGCRAAALAKGASAAGLVDGEARGEMGHGIGDAMQRSTGGGGGGGGGDAGGSGGAQRASSSTT